MFKMNNLNKRLKKRGFNLAEVVVASAVMALMMVSLIGYVQSAGTMWQKSHETISLSNEANSLLDFIERELWSARSITSPGIGEIKPTIVYSKIVSDYQGSPQTVEVDFRISSNPATGIASASIATDTIRWTNAAGWSVGATSGSNKLLLARTNYFLTYNLKSLEFYRKANRLLEITVKMHVPRPDQEFERELTLKRLVIMR